jgi:hypothetical protein
MVDYFAVRPKNHSHRYIRSLVLFWVLNPPNRVRVHIYSQKSFLKNPLFRLRLRTKRSCLDFLVRKVRKSFDKLFILLVVIDVSLEVRALHFVAELAGCFVVSNLNRVGDLDLKLENFEQVSLSHILLFV